jgi:hypothetical protein
MPLPHSQLDYSSREVGPAYAGRRLVILFNIKYRSTAALILPNFNQVNNK